MNDLELDVEILFAKANFSSHLEKGTIEMNNEYFNLLQEKMARLINENQELKKQQKEFIDWLENEIRNCKYGEENYADGDDMTYHNENELRKEILSKYKEIVGDKE